MLHKVYISIMVLVVLSAISYMSVEGYTYYRLNLEERFYHDQHTNLKPSGAVGHGLGIIGSFFMVAGVSLYMLRKRIRRFSRIGVLRYWLEFHIFLCTLGPALVLFHTAFKFGGIVAVSFWSMVAVVLSGVIGRYIYLQIPRTIEGREMSLQELEQKKDQLNEILRVNYQLNDEVLTTIMNAVKARPDRTGGNAFLRFLIKFRFEREVQKQIRKQLKSLHLKKEAYRGLIRLIHSEIRLNRKIDRLVSMQNLFRYWHVAHLPFALVMLVIMIVHVSVTLVFGYKWIF